jgi:hypothetical protein
MSTLCTGQEVANKAFEWVKWYEYHRKNERGVKQELKFMKKALDGSFELIALLVECIIRIDNGERPGLVLPAEVIRGMRAHGT